MHILTSKMVGSDIIPYFQQKQQCHPEVQGKTNPESDRGTTSTMGSHIKEWYNFDRTLHLYGRVCI